MVYSSKYQHFKEPETGVIQYVFSNKYGTPEDKPLLIDALDPSRYITYGQLKDQVLQFAAGLQDICDFKSDDVLALYAPNQYDYSIPVFGAIAANGAVSTANPNYNIKELSYQLDQIKAKVLVCHESNLKTALVAARRTGIPRKRIFLFGDQSIQGIKPFKTALVKERKVTLVELSYQEAKTKVAYLCFSSGTTGKSKGVMTTHSNATASVSQYDIFEESFINKKSGRMIGVLPLFHIFGLMTSLHIALYWGIPVYFLPRFELTLFCKTIETYRISYALLVPPIILMLAKTPLVDNYDLSSLCLTVSGAAPLGADLVNAVTTRFPQMIVKQAYGLTETSPCAVIEPTDRPIHGSIGLLMPNMLAKIVDENDNEVPQGERGELWLKGPNVMKGYINNPEATADCIDQEGYFHTGDIVIVDKDQHFYIVDRKKELIKYKGFQVPPAELEDIMLKLSVVQDCAVIGIYDDEQATEIPRAYIVLTKGTLPTRDIRNYIMKFVADQVVSYKQIRSIRFVESIPRSPAGKILRRILSDQATAEKENLAKL
ncbi:unnamed protein product [Rhizopus stolonifer]